MRLSISQKFILSVALFLVPMGVLFYFNIDQVSSNIQFSQLEQEGERYQRPLVRLLAGIGEYRMSGWLDGEAARKSREHAEAEITEDFNKLNEMHALYGQDLQVTDAKMAERGKESLKPGLLSAKWASLQGKHERTTPSVGPEFDKLMSDVRDLIAYVGDTSNLTLDPDLDSYYIMDVSSLAIPDMMERMMEASRFVHARLESPVGFSDEDLTQTAIYAAFLEKADMSRISGSLETALIEDKNFYGVSPTLESSLKGPFAEFKSKGESLIALLDGVSKGRAIGEVQFNDAVMQTSYASTSLWHVAANELDKLLQIRIDGYKEYRNKLVLATLVALFVAGIIFVIALRGIIRPLKGLERTMERLAAKELDVMVPYQEQQDEVGKMAVALESLRQTSIDAERLHKEQQSEQTQKLQRQQKLEETLKAFDSRISGLLQTVSSAVDQLFGTSKIVLTSAADTDSRSQNVVQSIGNASQNVSAVAAASEELSVSINEISAQMHKSTEVSNDAVNKTQKADVIVENLTQSANKIGEIVGSISEIAGQINLLALNASIESARAGEAGKGFAVVASEVKNLANQTSKATEEISSQIRDVQNVSYQVADALKEIRTTILQMNEIATSIASAIEEQGAATQEIARNIQNASVSTQSVSQNMEQVRKSSLETDEAAKKVSEAAQLLSKQSNSLTTEIDSFLSQIKS